jgi:enterochelin esterase-like enzyme
LEADRLLPLQQGQTGFETRDGMTELIERIRAGGAGGPDLVAQWLQSNRFPLVEPAGVTFVYHGKAETVRLRHWIFGLPDGQALERVDGTDLWHLFVELPPGSRVEYKFEVVEQGAGRWFNDPLNPILAHDPFGANSVCATFGYERPDWTIEDPDTPPGAIDQQRMHSAAFGDERSFKIYLPAHFRRSKRYPLLIGHDGSDFLSYAALKVVLDNLIHRRVVAPIVVALSDPVDRLAEYCNSLDHACFVVEELLPHLRAAYPLRKRASANGLMGASLGAVASLATARRYPGVFGNLLLQSGSFVLDNTGERRRDPLFDRVAAFMQVYCANPGRPVQRLYVSCGLYEGLIHENRAMAPLFRKQGIQLRYEEVRDGHHWENWRDRLESGLSWLFPHQRSIAYNPPKAAV